MYQSPLEVERLAQLHHAELLEQANKTRLFDSNRLRKAQMRHPKRPLTRAMRQPPCSSTT
jgi:hypothetical protein